MGELEKALAEIGDIRSQMARSAMFRGYGPAVVAATGGIAVAIAAAQALWPETFAASPVGFLMVWVAGAAIAAGLVGTEMYARTRRYHGGLADAMLFNAIEALLPAAAAGVVVFAVVLQFAPHALWILPGLWQILVAVGIFATLATLPRAVSLIAAWYFVAGTVVLILAAGRATAEGAGQGLAPFDPWMMGVPFAVGQIAAGAVLWAANLEGADDGA